MKASVFIGTSLDGFIARANGAFDFLPAGGGEPHGYDEFMATVDALVIGRKTFDTVMAFDAWPYSKKPVFVLSTRPLPATPPGAFVERMSGAPADIVSQLAGRGIQHAYVDGGITVQRFLQAGLIQRLIITRVPVLIGTGSRSLARCRATSRSRTSPRASTPAVSFRVSMRLSSRSDFEPAATFSFLYPLYDARQARNRLSGNRALRYRQLEMSKAKSVRRTRRPASALLSRTPRPDGADRRSDSPAQRPARDPRSLLDRVLDVPQLAHVVPRLQPEVLHRLIQSCGLEDCGELVALATPDQLARVFDLDLWRAGQPGLDEQFDADRFGVWLEVLIESGASVAAQTLADMDAGLVTTALAQHALVFDCAAVAPPTSDGEEVVAARSVHDGLGCEVGGYLVLAKGTESWDAIAAVLAALEAEHNECFHQVMRGCRSLSNSRPEIDGLDDLPLDGEQAMFDLAFARERRREQQGYVTPAQARAFLQMSRQLRLGHDTTPPGNPVARAYFRALEWTTAEDAASGSRRLPSADAAPAPEDSAAAVAAVVDLLFDAGILAQPPRALLNGTQGGDAPRLARIQAHLQFAHAADPAAYATRSQELAYLANTIVAGCAIQARPFSAQEASDAAVAVCNLGLENWPLHWLPAKARRGSSVVDAGTALPDDFLVGHDLVSVFQVGWTVLYRDVCMDAAERLIDVLTALRCADRETQAGINQLRIEMKRQWKAGAPWRARDALEVIAILDMPAWAALLGLIDECPVMHAGIGASRIPARARSAPQPSSSFRRTARLCPSANSRSRCRRRCAADGSASREPAGHRVISRESIVRSR